MQKHKFNVTCPDALFMETAHSPPENKNSGSMFQAPVATEGTMRPANPTGCKNTSLV
jgi:hypothetical protein